MDYISCTKQNSNKIVNMTLEFWIINSMEHITVILNSQQENGILLPDTFRSELTEISEKLSKVLTEVKKNYLINPRNLILNFLNINRHFINILERMKFEVINGMPFMYQFGIHLIYEQEYASEIFKMSTSIPSSKKCPSYPVIKFNSPLLSGSVMYCICSSIYFWSIIAAEHADFLINLIPNPYGADNILNSYRIKFNNICYIISEMKEITNSELYAVVQNFSKYSNILLNLIYEVYGTGVTDKLFDTSPEYPNAIIKHIANEHLYIKSICEDFEIYLKK